jgi:nucleoside-diphosphate-sugar epimerase
VKQTHLITGATGFVGGAILLELIVRTDAEVVCLVRPGSDRDARQRFEGAVRKAAGLYDRDFIVEEALQRCRVVPADITRPLCGVAPDELPPISDVWHAAATLEYENEREDEIIRQNVGGTTEVVRLAQASGARAFNYISTAYVAGRREGVIPEELPDPDGETNNAYERSKIAAELVVADAGFERTRIMRPGIVIGHSRTLGATTFTGMYGFTRGLRNLERDVRERLGGFLSRRQLRLRADPTAPLGIIPVDTVARHAVQIACSDSNALVFHLTNASPPSVGEVVGAIAEEVGIRRPRYVDSAREFSSIDQEVDDGLDFYRSYIESHKLFDRTNADAVTGTEAAAEWLPSSRVSEYVAWYLGRLGSHQRVQSATA